jgi:hypothetical protein
MSNDVVPEVDFTETVLAHLSSPGRRQLRRDLETIEQASQRAVAAERAVWRSQTVREVGRARLTRKAIAEMVALTRVEQQLRASDPDAAVHIAALVDTERLALQLAILED